MMDSLLRANGDSTIVLTFKDKLDTLICIQSTGVKTCFPNEWLLVGIKYLNETTETNFVFKAQK